MMQCFARWASARDQLRCRLGEGGLCGCDHGSSCGGSNYGLSRSLLCRAQFLLSAGAHPTAVADALHLLAARAVEVLHGMAIPVELSDHETGLTSSSRQQSLTRLPGPSSPSQGRFLAAPAADAAFSPPLVGITSSLAQAIYIYIYIPSTRKGTIDRQVKSNPRNNLIHGRHRCGKGRNSRGIITARHRGGGHKRLYRKIDFRRNQKDISGRIVTIEYDPNRNAYICLIHYGDGEKGYILHPRGAIIGDTIVSGTKVPISMGNALPLTDMPLGTAIHNIEITRGRGGQLARAAGAVAKLIAKEGKSATLRLPSGEVRLVSQNCLATVGQVGNVGVNQKSLGRAGSKCWLGKRPVVREVVMNPVDHPHGGGEGKAPIGRKKPTTPWGYPALGRRTRKRKKYSDSFILRRRK
nr:uncharacterized protein LOC112936211 [Oryza sativa Japonica Group]